MATTVIVISLQNVSGQEFGFVPQKAEPSTVSNLAFADLLDGLPQGLQESQLIEKLVIKDGHRRWLGSLVYGSSNSRAIAVMVIVDSQRFFVDRNRNQRFENDEEIPPSVRPGCWLTNIDAEFVQGNLQYEHQPQTVEFRWDARRQLITCATAGSMAGSFRWQQKTCRARYVDQNANGNWFDSEDRLLIDVNGDGKLNEILERFSCHGMCRIDEKLYSIGGDPRGKKLSIREVTQQGKLAPRLTLENDAAHVVSIKAALTSATGGLLLVTELDKAISCPVGRYRIENLQLEIQANSEVFRFVFDANNSEQTEKFKVEIVDEQTKELDLLGSLKLQADTAIIRNGDQTRLNMTPLLTTSSGLYLTRSSRGKNAANTENRLLARCTSAGRPFHIDSSGFF